MKAGFKEVYNITEKRRMWVSIREALIRYDDGSGSTDNKILKAGDCFVTPGFIHQRSFNRL